MLASIGFTDLEGRATDAVERERLRSEGKARFGSALFTNTPPESFCIETLADLEPDAKRHEFDEGEVATRFRARPEFLPNTLSDCLHELAYWHAMYGLRRAVDRYADSCLEVGARERFVFDLLAQKRSRTPAEGIAVFRYLVDADRMDCPETDAILLNLIGASRA